MSLATLPRWRLLTASLATAALACGGDGGTPTEPLDDARAREILRQPPFAPTDVSLFTPETYETAPPTAPTAAPGPTEAAVRAHLTATLEQRFGAGSPRVAEGLAVLDDPQLAQFVPDYRLRAALAHLTGTAGEAAIATLRSGAYELTYFGDLGGAARPLSPVRPAAIQNGSSSAKTSSTRTRGSSRLSSPTRRCTRTPSCQARRS